MSELLKSAEGLTGTSLKIWYRDNGLDEVSAKLLAELKITPTTLLEWDDLIIGALRGIGDKRLLEINELKQRLLDNPVSFDVFMSRLDQHLVANFEVSETESGMEVGGTIKLLGKLVDVRYLIKEVSQIGSEPYISVLEQ